LVPAAYRAIVNAQAGANMAAAGLNLAGQVFFAEAGPGPSALNLPRARNLLARSALQMPAPPAGCGRTRGIQMKTRIRTSTLPTGLPVRFYLAVAAMALALLAIPHIGHAQGIVRGAQEGSAEGNRVAGPVGGLVGGAVGAGVGGAMGAVRGVFGIERGYRYRCRGFYDRYDRFHCYR
jgi:hypothetical protein